MDREAVILGLIQKLGRDILAGAASPATPLDCR